MIKDQSCRRILLAGAEGCKIIYCDGCGVAEMELGALSVRLELNALHNLQAVLGQAAMKLSVLKATKVSSDFEYDKLDLY
ncbi:MAG TPA: hypothetical protein VK946_05755 [Methylotenera sp.]|nr:hypothetical protein [Methylotenera sp.]